MEAVGIWVMLDAHDREFNYMNGYPLPLRTQAIRSECDRTEDKEGNFCKVLLVETIIHNSKAKEFLNKQNKK